MGAFCCGLDPQAWFLGLLVPVGQPLSLVTPHAGFVPELLLAKELEVGCLEINSH